MAYVYQLLGKLQAVAIDFCISTLDEQKLDHLTRLNEKFLELAGTGSSADIHAADRKFHNYLAQLSENPYLISFTDQLTLQACRNENQFFKNYSRQRTSYENHRRIIDALIKRDLKTAQKEAEDNWLISIDYES